MKNKKLIIVIVSVLLVSAIGLAILGKVLFNNLFVKDASLTELCFVHSVSIDDKDTINVTELCDTTGFHGDGELAYRIELSESEAKNVEKQIKDKWNKGKLTKDVETVVYGGKDKDGTEYEGHVAGIDIPKLEDSYWNIKSEHKEPLLENYFDYSYAMYDKENRVLYFFENHI